MVSLLEPVEFLKVCKSFISLFVSLRSQMGTGTSLQSFLHQTLVQVLEGDLEPLFSHLFRNFSFLKAFRSPNTTFPAFCAHASMKRFRFWVKKRSVKSESSAVLWLHTSDLTADQSDRKVILEVGREMFLFAFLFLLLSDVDFTLSCFCARCAPAAICPRREPLRPRDSAGPSCHPGGSLVGKHNFWFVRNGVSELLLGWRRLEKGPRARWPSALLQ